MPIKRIYSAGGIVLRLTPFAQDVPSGKRRVEVLVTQHSKHKGWDFPKGHIELGESAEQAAVREVEEETGVKGQILEKVGATEYFYFDEGERILKTVVYFLMKYEGEGEATTAFEVSDMVWLPVGEVEDKLTFKDTKTLWKNTKEKRITFLKLKKNSQVCEEKSWRKTDN